MIHAILDAGFLSGKIKLQKVVEEIRIPVPLPLENILIEETMSNTKLETSPVMVFRWRRQLKKRTHLYTLKKLS